MKKLMAAVAVAIVAIATNAATYSWTAQSYWVTADESNPLEVLAYVFDANANSLASITAALDENDLTALDKAIGSGSVNDEGSFSFSGNGLTDNGGDPLTASMFALLLDTTDKSTATRYYTTDVLTKKITDAVIAGGAEFVFGGDDGIITGDPANWSGTIGGSTPTPPTPPVIPEPTSGLLLLLGAAGLALRRKA